jgi:hypothetical protein
MDPRQRRTIETSAGLFLMGVGLLVLLLNATTSSADVTVSLLGLGICVVGGFVYR